ncbi:MAG TPA: AmmeMemoRadiSam system protein B, partial [Bryobacteraceae bacterium]|nr:AmmeMemoRadiSam system protein B [Bryobacteraceae bacterium]
EPNRFGLTRKPFVTPLGEAHTHTELVEELVKAAPEALRMEDYCHSIEHSIEFQVLFLQHRFGPSIRILPILCGAYAKSIFEGGRPEDDPNVARFVDALGELGARRGQDLFWVLGVDMAHMGRRYGDSFNARANQREMNAVARRDTARIDALNAGDSKSFWEQVQESQDDLKWCGSAPIYTFLKAVPEARGSLERYEQWNIDNQSVVSFAALQFQRS